MNSPEQPLVSPDTRNNNRLDPLNPCMVSPEKEQAPEGRKFQGEILYNPDGSAYIIQQDSNRRNAPLTPLAQRYKVFSVRNNKEELKLEDYVAKDASSGQRVLICFLCKLSFSTAASFEAHIQSEHCLDLLSLEKHLLIDMESSAILQSPGPTLAFLHAVSESNHQSSLAPEALGDNLEPENKSSPDKSSNSSAADMTPEEVARSLMLASELSASRLLQQVSQSAFPVATLHSPNRLQSSEPAASRGSPDTYLSGSKHMLNSQQMMSMQSAAAARNSCKTLKCPKCNWHYKYQETLEIHMKEKHPDTEVSCLYCLHNQPHPKLARGETYNCGYKPYRCDICKYSTTTKGNLSIHMQSDKHLNNVQELRAGGKMIDPASLIHSQPPTTRPPSAAQITEVSAENSRNIGGSGSNGPSRPGSSTSFRCEPCNYETAVARNLRIHMTSDKHSQNMLLLQKKLATSPTFSPVDALQQSFLLPGFPAAPNMDSANIMQLQNSIVSPVGDSDELNLFQCGVCLCFKTDSLDEIISHVQLDRSQPSAGDIAVISGHYFCNLCQYKTHLKANFQLHTKTDKHLQRLILVNHVREGGPQNEWRLSYVNVNNPVQVRCNACNDFFTSSQKLQLHCFSARHRCYQLAFLTLYTKLPSTRHHYECCFCDLKARNRGTVLGHLHSQKHSEVLTEFQDLADQQNPPALVRISEIGEPDDREIDDDKSDTEARKPRKRDRCEQLDQEEDAEMIDAVHCCAWCNFTCKTSGNLREHVELQHGEESSSGQPTATIVPVGGGHQGGVSCPLCQTYNGRDREQLAIHLSEAHSVRVEGISRLLALLPSGSGTTGSISPPASVPADSTTTVDSEGEASSDNLAIKCKICTITFNSQKQLQSHQVESGHFEAVKTSDGNRYVCFQKDCERSFYNVNSLQVHFREFHSMDNQHQTGCVSDRHVYRYRCSQCSLAFRTDEKLQTHSLYHLMRAATRCTLCGKNFRSIPALRRHVEITHSHTAPTEMRADEFMEPKLVVDQEADMACDNTENGESSAETFNDDRMNDQIPAELGYNDPARKFKCHKCKMGFTKQIYLTNHQKSLIHRQSEKGHYSIEKYHDPSRPFKCEICKESFTQKNILVVHFNSVSHLHKIKKLYEQKPNKSGGGFSAANPSPKTQKHATSTPSFAKHEPRSTKSTTVTPVKPYKCNICKAAYSQGSTLDIHLRSVAHQSKVAKVQDLIATGEVDLNLPLIEQPEFPVSPQVTSLQKKISSEAAKNPSKLPELTHDQLQMEQLQTLIGMFNFNPFMNQAFQNYSASNPFALLSCQKCGSMFDTENSLKNHQMTVCGTSSIPITNGFDGKSFSMGEKQLKTEPCDSSSKSHEDVQLDKSTQQHQMPTVSKTSNAVKQLLYSYGFEVVMQYNETRQRKRKSDNDDKHDEKKLKLDDTGNGLKTSGSQDEVNAEFPEMGNFLCDTCGKSFSSVWVLKAHCEQFHKNCVPLEEIEKVSELFLKSLEDTEQLPTRLIENKQTLRETKADPVHEPKPPALSLPDSSTPSATTNLLSAENISVSSSANNITGMGAWNPAMMAMMGAFPGFPFMASGFPGSLAGQFPNPFMPMMIPPGMGDLMNNVPDSSFNVNGLQDLMKASAFPGVSSAISSTVAGSPATPVIAPIVSMSNTQQTAAALQQSQKRARTRITDEQLAVLRAHFDIENSPTEQQIEEMSTKSLLPPKVIKHWFRNTLFKERQRNKDSPYNFSIPPSLGIDLIQYEKTGEAKVITLADDKSRDSPESSKVEPASNTETEISLGEISVKDETPVKGLIQKVENEICKTEAADETAQDNVTENVGRSSIEQLNSTPKQQTDMLLSAQETLRRLTAMPSNPINVSLPQNLSVQAMGNAFSLLAAAASTTNTAIADSEMKSNQFSSGPVATPSADTMTNLIANALSPGGSISGMGRRANRTRFSDSQLKTLQEFFETQPYPKDDDLEFLSKKLHLSPRVIVVWFQNARQKARKVYENQPQPENADRFSKTPGCNFQCKGCSLVFQRYYELIQHQQKQCFKDKPESDQKNYNEIPHSTASSNSNATSGTSKYFCDLCNIPFNGSLQLEEHLKVHASNPLLFSDSDNNSGQTLADTAREYSASPNRASVRTRVDTPQDDSNTVVCIQKPKMRDRRTGLVRGQGSFNKRCLFCGILFYSKSSMESHLESRHHDLCLKTTVNIDLLPDAEEVPTITMTPLSASDQNLVNGNENRGDLAQSMLSFGMYNNSSQPNYSGKPQDNIDVLKKLSEGRPSSPLDLSKPMLKVQTAESSAGMVGASNGGSPTSSSFLCGMSDNDDSGSAFGSQCSSPSPQQHSITPGGHPAMASYPRPPPKRYRTHLTALQVNVMRHLFGDYKTPSMAECELLGGVLGLHKRVVQVWFQNARAKERKAKGIGSHTDEQRPTLAQSRCTLCGVAYSPKHSLQDHIFTREHIDKVRAAFKDHGQEEMASLSPTSSSDNSANFKSSAVQSLPAVSANGKSQTVSTAESNGNTNLAQNFLPYMPYYANLAASSMMYSGFPGTCLPMSGLVYDPNVHGTPVHMLQIPTSVMQLISAAMQTPENAVRFMQDGKKFNELALILSEKDFGCVAERDLVVGWGCKRCCTVFPSESLFKDHQKAVCQSNDPGFKLIQTHYECKRCVERFGTQTEFKCHCETEKHCRPVE